MRGVVFKVYRPSCRNQGLGWGSGTGIGAWLCSFVDFSAVTVWKWAPPEV